MMVLMHIPDKIGHRWPRVPDEFVGYSPHLPKGAVNDLAAQIGAHEEHAVFDCIENRIELLEKDASFLGHKFRPHDTVGPRRPLSGPLGHPPGSAIQDYNEKISADAANFAPVCYCTERTWLV